MKRAKIKTESVCVIDLETRSSVDIKRGAKNYFAAKDAAIICLGFAIDDGPVEAQWMLTENGKPAPLPKKILAHKGKLVAQNYFFELCAFQRFYPGTRMADPSNWLCTQAMARRLQVGPAKGALRDICEALDIPSPKNDKSKALINAYSIPFTTDRFNGKKLETDGVFLKITPEDKKAWLKYVADDTDRERQAYFIMSPHWEPQERAVFAVDTVQQARGVPIDVKGAQALQAKLDAAKENAAARAEEIAGRNASGTLILSGRDEFLKWLKKTWGVELPNAQAATLAAFEDENEINEDLAEALAIRSLLQSRATGKAQKVLDLQHNGRYYKPSEYHLAHTGRWQSWGANFFNFSRKPLPEMEVLATAQNIKDRVRMTWEQALAAARNVRDFAPLMRGLVCAPKGRTLITTDWRGIENYLSTYYAGDTEKLKRIEAGESPYLIFGEVLFGRTISKKEEPEYPTAKIAELQLGYGSGHVTLARAAKIQAKLSITLSESKRIVTVWRNANRLVVLAWKTVEHCFRLAVAGQESFFESRLDGKVFKFSSPRPGLVTITLPNGYTLRYPHAAISSEGELYYAPQGKPKKLYGGKIWENIIQCVARQLLCEALQELEAEGVEVILHVYDEIVVECDTKDAKKVAARVAEIMTTAPAWAPELKLEVEQKINKRWGK